MRQENISSISIIPEEYDVQHWERIDLSILHSEMTYIEQRFINGLIRYYKPKNILEVGVSRGGGSVVILNAINDMPEAKLTSIDRTEYYYADQSISVGSDVDTYLGNTSLDKKDIRWKLIKGADSSEVMDDFSEYFDFVVIDTAHRHPIETLNFLCVLPYLSDDAIVILHDISLFLHEEFNGSCLASRILISSVVADKLLPKTKSTPYISNDELVNNICAIQITPDTRKYISNVFLSLSIPWEYFPADDIESIRTHLEKHYGSEQIEQFDEALRWYYVPLERKKRKLTDILSDEMIFYGAGYNMKNLLHLFDSYNIPFNYQIWDINALNIKSIKGHKIYYPDFKTKVTNKKALITIGEKSKAESIAIELKNVGFDIIQFSL